MHIEPIELEGRDVVRVSVEAGDEKPYYLASKGLVPAGVFTRLGPATVPMGSRDIRRMIREADDDFFETRHARMQDLTFETARTATPAARAPAAGPAGIRITRAERIAAETPGAGPGRLERFLVSFALERGEFSREEAQRALDAGRDTTLKVINGMVASGALVKTGRARATRYRISDDLRRAGDAGWPV